MRDNWDMLRTLLSAAALTLLVISCSRLNHPDPISPGLEQSRAPHTARATGEIAVATFNVHMESPKILVAAIVSDRTLRDADVILLQEIEWPSDAGRSHAADIANVLGMHHVYAPSYGLKGGGSHGIAILSRFPLSDPRVVGLPRNDTVVNSARRVAMAATIATSTGPVRIWNVHLDNRINPSRRFTQLSPVFEAIDQESHSRVIFGGDLNTSPFCWIGHLVPVPCGLQARKIDRAVAARGFALPTKRAGATHRYLGMKLDAIFVRGIEAHTAVVGRTQVSDHLPLRATITLN